MWFSGGVRQPQVEAWSIKAGVARTTIGRCVGPVEERPSPEATGNTTGRRVSVGGIGAA